MRPFNNFRQLGGYETKDGRIVKNDVFYRCGALADMNEAELQEVREKKIRTLFDFRSEAEVEKKPDPDIGARYFHVSALTDEAGNEIDLSPEGMKNISEAQMYSPEYF